MHTSFRAALLLAAGTLALASCKKDDDAQPTPTPTPTPVQSYTVKDLMAAGAPSTTGPSAAPKHYTFYSLADNKVIPYTDSNSTKWDVAFKTTTILINGGSSGPGQGGAQVKTMLFDDLKTADATGYATDAANAPAIPKTTWYSYDQNTHVVTPVPGKILEIRTATGKYAKLEIQNYYKGAPATPDAYKDAGGYYTFRYVYQPSGTSLQ